MATIDDIRLAEPPPRARAVAITATLIVLWGALRLVIFDTSVLPLTYALALLVHVWTRDRVLLWSMAAIFALMHAAKMVWLLPPGMFTPAEAWANYGTTFANIAVAATAVQLILVLRARLDQAFAKVRAQSEELASQNEELAMQNEELAAQTEELTHQAEELTQQGEELASQNEELQSQSEEIGGLLEALDRRERLLQTLLDTARLSGSEGTALDQIAAAAVDLFNHHGVVAAVYERTEQGLVMRALHGRPGSLARDGEATVVDDFAALTLAQNRTASMNDLTLRPDLRLPPLPGSPGSRAALCTPVRLGGDVYGAFIVYDTISREWTDEEYRLVEWLAAQCGRVIQALRVQSDLREADRRKSEFLATLSHELRNPLAAIEFAVALLEAGKEESADAVDVIRRQFPRLIRLVDDLLDSTRFTTGKVRIRKARTDLVQIVRQAVDATGPDMTSAGHSVAIELPEFPVRLDADADRLGQVVVNLLHNAVRYTSPGGRIVVRVRVAAGEAVLTVGDNGIGIDPADLERVFDMFTQIGDPGSGGLGIGLALVRGVVGMHGGRVEARSRGLGHGSEFIVTLPLAADSAAVETAAASRTPVGDPRPCRVLVVDDNLDSAAMIAALLEVHGHRARVAHDAAAAIHAAEEFSPDVALLDIGLPGIDGYELAQRLRANQRSRPIRLIALTGWGQESDRARALQAGFDAHLTKPAGPEAILAELRISPGGQEMR